MFVLSPLVLLILSPFNPDGLSPQSGVQPLQIVDQIHLGFSSQSHQLSKRVLVSHLQIAMRIAHRGWDLPQ